MIYIVIVPDIVYNNNMAKEIYSSKEAASKLGLSPDHVRRLLLQGKLQGKKLGHDWIVFKLDYKRKRKPKGESKK